MSGIECESESGISDFDFDLTASGHPTMDVFYYPVIYYDVNPFIDESALEQYQRDQDTILSRALLFGFMIGIMIGMILVYLAYLSLLG